MRNASDSTTAEHQANISHTWRLNVGPTLRGERSEPRWRPSNLVRCASAPFRPRTFSLAFPACSPVSVQQGRLILARWHSLTSRPAIRGVWGWSGSPTMIGLVSHTPCPIPTPAHGRWRSRLIEIEWSLRRSPLPQPLMSLKTGVDEITLWIHDPELRIGGTEFALERTLHRMIVSLPLDQVAQWPDGVSVEAFEAQDASEWLRVNNRAFRGHPEQSEWSSADLERRLELAWFDPSGLRMIWLNERLAAFNWTKIHPGVGEVVGEIHVIAVDPDFRGQGLGKAATLEGLNYLHEVRGATKAILYVDDANAEGLHLYRGLGFIADELHRAYRWNASKH